MDLVARVNRVAAVMEHCAKDGSPKKQCALPITGLESRTSSSSTCACLE